MVIRKKYKEIKCMLIKNIVYVNKIAFIKTTYIMYVIKISNIRTNILHVNKATHTRTNIILSY